MSTKSNVVNHTQTSCGFDCVKNKLTEKLTKYKNHREKIPFALLPASSIVRTQVTKTNYIESMYKQLHAAKSIPTLDTSGLYTSSVTVANPNASAKLVYGGEDYSDLVEREYYLDVLNDILTTST